MTGIDDWQNQALQWATLLHDVGKPEATKVEDGEIVSPHHSEKGTLLARKIMADAGVQFDIREASCTLIRWHMRPHHLEGAEDPAYHVVFTSCLAENFLLYLLASADIRGRFHDDRAESEEWIDLWSDQCEELKCFYEPYPFVNSQARVDFYAKRCFRPYYTPYMKDKFEVVILSGLPGVSKTHMSQNRFSNLPLVELDLAREELGVNGVEKSGQVLQLTKEMCRKHLRKKQPFVFSAVNGLSKTRRKWTGLFMGYGATVRMIYLESPLGITLAQNSSRDRVVTEHVILGMWDRFEVPNLMECHELEKIFVSPKGEER